MRRCEHVRGYWVLAATLLLPGSGAAQVTTPATGPLAPYAVGTALPPLAPGAEMVSMTLEQVLARAVERNLDIQTAQLAPRMQAFTLQSAQAAFSPTLSGSYRYNNSTRESTSQLDGGARTTNQQHSFNTSLSQNMRWYGGRLAADFNNSRTATNNTFTTLNPSFNSSVSVNYTQPLLSGLRTDNQRAALQTQEIQGQITEIQLTSLISNITDQVRSFYWNLRATIEQIEIQQRALTQSELLLAENQLRVQLGSMAQIQVIQAQSQVAAAQQSLLNAQVQWRNAELNLKSLLISGADDPLLSQTINPSELPTLQTQAVDIAAALQTALGQRADLRQQRYQLEMAELDLAVTRDGRLPDLDLTAAYSLQGIGGNVFERAELGGAPVLTQQGGYLDGLSSIGAFETPTWSLTMNFSYPIGMRSGKANAERARLQFEQTNLAIKSQELAIITEVTSAGLSVTDTSLQLEAARRSRALAEEGAVAETVRFSAGAATNFEVGQANETLTSARLSELRALINHINAIADFERVQRVGR
ncbi:MAG: TolC family protein [Gemmatimonadetes bacterium]|nr:TolC family protein [Gemmatimonadota bacterium]MDA1104840.1 TolC family protein [Gemmatimonadota bacterium]